MALSRVYQTFIDIRLSGKEILFFLHLHVPQPLKKKKNSLWPFLLLNNFFLLMVSSTLEISLFSTWISFKISKYFEFLVYYMDRRLDLVFEIQTKIGSPSFKPTLIVGLLLASSQVDCTNPCIASLIFLALDLVIGPSWTCKGSLRLGPLV